MIKNLFSVYIITALIIISAKNLLAQFDYNKPLVLNYNIKNYDAGNQNWAVTTNENGVVNIGNNRGLLEFDGSNWELFQLPGEPIVRSVATGSDGRVYVGAYEEFGYWERAKTNKRNYISLSDSFKAQNFHNDEIWRIVELNDTIYFQSFNSLYQYSKAGIEIINIQETPGLLSKAREKVFIQKIDGGLYEIKNKELHYLEGSEIFSDDEIKFVLPYGEKDFLVGATEKGLYIWDGNEFYPWDIDSRKKLNSKQLNCGLEVDGKYIVGTITDGIFIFNKSGSLLHHLNTENQLQNNTVLSLSSDKDNNVWAGLDRGVDYIIMNSSLDFYTDSKGKLGSFYSAALFNDKLWVGTNQGLYSYKFLPNGTLENSPEMQEGTQGQVWQTKVMDEKLIFGHNNGTYQIGKTGRMEKISEINGGFDIKEFIYKGERYALQSSYSNLVVYKNIRGEWKLSHTVDNFIEPVSRIEFDPMGYIWAKHLYKGIMRLQLNHKYDSIIETNYFGNRVPGGKNAGIAKINNRIVFATGEKIYTYNDLQDSVVPYETINEQIDAFRKARKIIKASEDEYWFIYSNNIGLFEIKGGEVNKTFSYDLYRQGVSMLSNYAEIVKLKDSLHLICLDNGFAVLNENRPLPGKKDIKVYLRKVISENRKGEKSYLDVKASDKRRKIPYAYRNITFTFASTEMSYKPVFRYQLKGLDEDFSKWTGQSKVEFTRLPYGQYTFLVQTKDIYNNLSPLTEYTFEIRPPWYLSEIALICYVFLFIIGLVFLRVAFKKRLKKHAIELEQKEKERRRREQMLVEQRYMRLKNRGLQSEVASKSIELANYTMTMINKNEVLLKIKDELQKLKKELGPRFPAYKYKRLNKMLEKSLSSEDEWKKFEFHFDQAHENFFKRLKSEYPELTPNDLKLCAYLRMNLSTKEIAPLLNISIRGVEVRRYRLRKRLNLKREDNLVEFLMGF